MVSEEQNNDKKPKDKKVKSDKPKKSSNKPKDSPFLELSDVLRPTVKHCMGRIALYKKKNETCSGASAKKKMERAIIVQTALLGALKDGYPEFSKEIDKCTTVGL